MKDLVQSSLYAPELNMKHLKKCKRGFNRKVVNITLEDDIKNAWEDWSQQPETTQTAQVSTEQNKPENKKLEEKRLYLHFKWQTSEISLCGDRAVLAKQEGDTGFNPQGFPQVRYIFR